MVFVSVQDSRLLTIGVKRPSQVILSGATEFSPVISDRTEVFPFQPTDTPDKLTVDKHDQRHDNEDETRHEVEDEHKVTPNTDDEHAKQNKTSTGGVLMDKGFILFLV